MMKKLTAILLLLVYTAGAAGTAVNYHYCCGQLIKISFANVSDNKGCRCNTGNKPAKCCKDVLKYQKSDQHRMVPKAQLAAFVTIAVEPPYAGNDMVVYPVNNYTSYNGIIDGPRRQFLPIFLLCRVFRI